MAAKPEDMAEYCTACNEPLELGQIGKCDACQASSEPTQWTNHYQCSCGEHWDDTWDCCCNDECPACNSEIEPYISDDGSVTDEAIEAAHQAILAELGLPAET